MDDRSAASQPDLPDTGSGGVGDPALVPQQVRAACAILAVEGLALVAAGLFLIYGTVFGHPGGVLRSLLAAVMAFGGAAALLAGARGLLRLSTGARSPMVVLQLLALPVGYSLVTDAGRVVWGGPILIAAVAVIYLLFTPPAREALDRPPID